MITLWIFLGFFSVQGFSQEEDASTPTQEEQNSNHVLIFGKKNRVEGIGQSPNQQSYKVNSEESGSKSLSDIYRQQASIVVPAQDFSDPLKLLMPRIRLQDTKLNEVYLNDLVLVDPQASLSDLRGFDLKSLESLDVFYGQSPAEFHSQSPAGVLHFYSQENFGRRHSIQTAQGFSLGQEYSMRYALNRELRHPPLAESYVFARRFLSKGDYTFYDANQTPYDSGDDKRSKRRNNSSSSGQVLSLLNYKWNNSEFSYLASTLDHRQDLGVDLLGLDSSSSKRTFQKFHRLSFKQVVNTNSSFWMFKPKLSLGLLWNDQRNLTEDPSQSFLVTSKKLKLNNLQKLVELRSEWRMPQLYLLASYRKSIFQGVKSFDESDAWTNVERDLQKGGVSFSWTPTSKFQMDAKYILANKKSFPINSENDLAPYASSSLSYEFVNGMRPYIQWSQSQRFPSVLEEVGDGGYFQASESLQNENYFHKEIGANFSFPNIYMIFSAAYYQDDVNQKIVWLPSSFGSFKAQNVSRTKVNGADISWMYAGRKFDLSFSQAWAKALDFGDQDNDEKSLAFCPEWIRVGSFAWKPNRFIKLGSDIRYQSAYLIDRKEQVQLGEYWSQNLYFDNRYLLNSEDILNELRFSVKVLNLWNQDSQSISAFGQQEGKVSASEVIGFPSPSRSFNLQIEYVF